jgi:hypothetical protein
MSQPLRRIVEPDPPNIRRANWLGRYLDVERRFDDKLKSTLTDAIADVSDVFERLGDGFSKDVRRQQLSSAKRSMREFIHEIFGTTTNLINDHRQDAAMAAVDAQLYDERGILSRIFPEPFQRSQYADSLRQTARRNVESVATRILFSERPLSSRVYKSEALANHLVSQAINRSLARGDTAKDLAKSVTSLIDPAVPGGVSYAARRLGTTEINNAFHAQAIHGAQTTPWVEQMEWNLSKVHEKDPGDECEIYAIQRYFDIELVPDKPHPFCRCYVTPKQQDYADFENSLISGHYDEYLDGVLGVQHDENLSARMTFENDPGNTEKFKAEVEKAKASGKDIYPWGGISPPERKLVNKFNVDRQAFLAIEETTPKAREKIIDKTIPKTIVAAKNPTQVSNWLHSNYEGLEVIDMDTTDVDVESAKEIATAFERLQNEYPDTSVKYIRIGQLPDGVPAETRQNPKTRKIEILLNDQMISDYEKFKRESKSNQDSGWLVKRDPEKPWEGTMTHEWGHVLDFTSLTRVQRQLDPKVWKRITGQEVRVPPNFFAVFDPDADRSDPKIFEEYQDWMLDQLESGYSFRNKAKTVVNAEEAVAEAFANNAYNGKPLGVFITARLKEEIAELKAINHSDFKIFVKKRRKK